MILLTFFYSFTTIITYCITYNLNQSIIRGLGNKYLTQIARGRMWDYRNMVVHLCNFVGQCIVKLQLTSQLHLHSKSIQLIHELSWR